MKLTLSFDNGPYPDVTPGVLDALAEAGASATFFVCGKEARDPARRPLLERIRAAGHRIGNHTESHRVELGATRDPDAPRREIEAAQAALGAFADADRLFRPYGAGGVLGPRLLSAAAVRHLCSGGYTCVLWNSVPRDWEDPAGWPARALADLRARPWTLLVLHDVPSGAMRVLPDFLARARDAGAELTAALPPACVPILRGQRVGSLAGLVSAD